MKKLRFDRITTTIEREWLAEIIAGTKKLEYRQIKPYWTKRFERVSVPFELRLRCLSIVPNAPSECLNATDHGPAGSN